MKDWMYGIFTFYIRSFVVIMLLVENKRDEVEAESRNNTSRTRRKGIRISLLYVYNCVLSNRRWLNNIQLYKL